VGVNRLDQVEVPEWLASKFMITPEGHLVGRATITNIGVFTYLRGDGTVVRELRSPKEVFKAESLATLAGMPIVNGHPKEKVTADNISQYQVGSVGQNILGDNIYVSADTTIVDPAAIQDVQNGKREFSCGYTCEVRPEHGRWLGVEYDAVQENILYNHLAIVDKARAGDTARIRLDHLDSADGVLLDASEIDEVKRGVIMPENMKTIKLDGVDYAAEAKVIEAYTLTKEKMDALAAEKETLAVEHANLLTEKTQLEAKVDTLTDTVETANKKIAELEAVKMDEAVIAKAVERRFRIVDAVRNAEVEVADGASEFEMQKAVILKVFPKATLDGRDQVYIDARFDGAVETLEANNDGANRELGADEGSHADGQDTKSSLTAEKARQAYRDRLVNKK